MGPVRQNPIQRTVTSVHMRVHCTVHNCCTQYITAQNRPEWVSELEVNIPFQHKHGYIRDDNRPDNFPSYPPDNQHCSHDVYLREGGTQCSKTDHLQLENTTKRTTQPATEVYDSNQLQKQTSGLLVPCTKQPRFLATHKFREITSKTRDQWLKQMVLTNPDIDTFSVSLFELMTAWHHDIYFKYNVIFLNENNT